MMYPFLLRVDPVADVSVWAYYPCSEDGGLQYDGVEIRYVAHDHYVVAQVLNLSLSADSEAALRVLREEVLNANTRQPIVPAEPALKIVPPSEKS